ncbi:MAG TPA: chemotaxis protein CheW [Geobacteraceae bacterium]|nr:chemotaxis protein CheW [Geobacteraceae bacterium]
MDRDIQEIKVVCFRLGRDSYALDIMRVREIIKPQSLSGLTEAPSFVEGVINLRGSFIPVVDLRKIFGIAEGVADEKCRLLIVVVDHQPIALIVDSVNEVASIPVSDLRPPPSVVKVAGYRYLIGVCLVKNELVMLVNLDKIFDGYESDELFGSSLEVQEA